MDEILASIRRIIESNEPVPQAGRAVGRAEPEGFMGNPANDDSEEVTLTIDETFAEESYAEAEPVATVPPPATVHSLQGQPVARQHSEAAPREPVLRAEPVEQPRSLSLADVAARVRAASERGAAERSSRAPEPQVYVPTVPPTASEHVEETEEHQPEVTPSRTEPEIAAETASERSPATEDVPAQAQPMSLISSVVGEQVARSFHSLALAIDDAERRTLDQMAEDMLRPMLQEWLDDNLPTLVERLVREEIERVTRGSRR